MGAIGGWAVPGSGDRDYWLAHCHGFSVVAAGHRLGIVEEVRFLSRVDRPDALVLRSGTFRLRRSLLPVASVEQVHPRSRQIAVHAATPQPGRPKQNRTRHAFHWLLHAHAALKTDDASLTRGD